MLIRKAEIEDAAGLAKVHIDTWRTAYRDIMPPEVLANLSYEKSSSNWHKSLSGINNKRRAFVAISDDGEIIGFVFCGPSREADPEYDGELYGIYVLQQFQGRGVGRALFKKALGWLMENSYRAMFLWVLKENRYRRFYERLGGLEVRSKIKEIYGVPLELISYGWPELGKLNIAEK